MCVGNKEMHMGQLQAGIIPVTPFQQNCTILFDAETKAGVVVDPGGEIERIAQVLDDNGIAVGAIWLTHGHIDHAGGAMDLKDRLGVEIVGPHRDDRRPHAQGGRDRPRGGHDLGLFGARDFAGNRLWPRRRALGLGR